ncbi:hypothetical protein [Microbacterium sp. CH12i]|uniref:hypothetical protein n=1 Tax=Microbacterium sp. CH12i TaxID=1479651 RepID=UPI000B2B0372|nr:hypothetical protein [Microbacterium sp. CH12i]
MSTRKYSTVVVAPTGIELFYMAIAAMVTGLLLMMLLGPVITGPALQIIVALIAAGLVFLIRYSPRIIRRIRLAVVSRRGEGRG